MVNISHLIPLFPFLAFLVNILFGRRLKKKSSYVAISAATISFLLSVVTFFRYLDGHGSYPLVKWLDFGNFTLTFGITVDPLTIMMLLVVTSIGTLIQIYSFGYMHDDEKFSRFFAYLSLFMCSMLGLVLADNLVMLFIFWEGVGLCSYLLISFWGDKRIEAAQAGMKAFITTRVADTGLLIGILLLFSATGTLNFSALAHAHADPTILTICAFLILCGAIGKSAQFPFHVWLPDAMEGPTPVSALIHAATMVVAGVYLIARFYWLFMLHEPALIWVAYIGGFTAFFAATIALVNHDIKRVLAYSTLSQLGYMMMALGVGSYAAGTFHLMTHAFFKALLFMCAGSVIHGVHTQDMREMGGLLSKMKFTGTTLIIGSLAIAGVPPLAGFWSKDEILAGALHSGHPILFGLGLFTSFLTAFYIFRLVFLVLFGTPRSDAHAHAHESPKTMTIPLCVLAFFSLFIGLIGSPFFHNAFQNFMGTPGAGHGHTAVVHESSYLVMGLSTIAGFLGIGLAYVFYISNNKILSVEFRAKFQSLYKVIYNKYYIDEIYEVLLIKPFKRLAELSFKFDAEVVDGAVNGTAHGNVWLAKISGWFDNNIVDGIVNGIATVINASSGLLRRIQTGFVQNYLLIGSISLLILIFIKFI